MEKTIEIPFGAKDSELNGWEYTIPENMEAEIKGGKIIVREKESEDERIRKDIITTLSIGVACDESALHPGATTTLKEAIAYLERQKEQKPASGNSEKPNNHAEWSEEDKKNFGEAISYIKDDSLRDFLKSLPERFNLQPKQERSEEDKERVRQNGRLDVCYNPEKYGLCHKVEWGEEDEKMWVHDDDIFLDAAKMIVEDSTRKSYGGVNKKSIIPWFYSLKERLKSLRPQFHWKPSEEQMRCLLDCVSKAKEIHNASVGGYDAYRILVSLFDDLHKLL